jgi:hypothetical protein
VEGVLVSLDVYLKRKRDELPEARKAADLLRANGFEDFATELECRHDASEYDYLYESNITHNLGQMAEAAGIYKHLWRPEEIGVTKASELIEPLREGLKKLRERRNYFETFNSSNGWGMYHNFVPWVQAYLSACEEYPDAEVSVSR